MERKKSVSFLVPVVSFLSFGFLPGITGVLPLFHIIGSFSAAAACELKLSSGEINPNKLLNINVDITNVDVIAFWMTGLLILWIDDDDDDDDASSWVMSLLLLW